MLLTADFETTTKEDDCRVWAWAVCEVGNPDYFKYGNSIDSFMDYAEKSKNSTFYFHNLKFDSEFIFVWLFEHGFKHVKSRKEEAAKTFTTLISDMGQFYSVKIIFEKGAKRTKYIQIYDSLKILPFSVEQVAKGFNLPISKLDLDYKSEREIGHELTPHEIAYIRNDVTIMAMALKTLFDQNLTKMTQGSNALHDYKETVGERNFDRWFPTPDYDADVRPAYKGGFTYVADRFKQEDLEGIMVFDVNSLYPWVMHDCPLPYGEPIYFRGKYVEDKFYNLYVQMFTCSFELKEDKIPTIQLKHNFSFIPTEYLHDSGRDEEGNLQEVTMCLTSVDLELFFDHYHVYNPEYHSGWMFKSTTGLFSSYIDKWMKVKIESTLNGNESMRTLSKLMLNALYGKFALSPKVASKYPEYCDGKIVYKTPKDEKGETIYEEREPLYIPVGIFITAWARHKTITSAQKVYDKFVYADTDSLHLRIDLPESLRGLSNKELSKLTTKELIASGIDLPEDFIVDPTALGAWKLESYAHRARFLRQKCYVEDSNKPETWDKPKYSLKKVKEECKEKGLNFDDEILKYKGWYNTDEFKITCAGMPSSCYEHVTWENFQLRSSFEGKLVPKHVKGGIVLVDTIFTIHPA